MNANSQWLPIRALAKRAERINQIEQDSIDAINRACVERMRQRSDEIARDCDALFAALKMFGERS